MHYSRRLHSFPSLSTLTHCSYASFVNNHPSTRSYGHHQFCCSSRPSRPKPPASLSTAKPREEEEEVDSDSVHQFCCTGSACSSPSSR
ncbi:hypothetical protein AMELA_G00286150 [Ameiurus melas]|uniref:Uncharacterized protein n=1 Tax=Ameiurus melas TaxID=219545 RepID=A0A7J5ZIK0_AMEME|nr:hypothetical protein AMELA_G00286150 [Ameiurus melas]